MIYLVKKICTSCNMKIELMDEHFGVDLQCPNCDADISVPDVNKIAEEKERLAKEIEELKNDSNFTQTNTITMGRPGQTLKVNAVTPPADLADRLKKEQALTAKFRKDEEILMGKLKGLQAANLSMNDELTQLKSQKEEFSKSLTAVTKLQKELSQKNSEVETLQKKLQKFAALTQNLKEISSVGNLDVISSPDDMAETMAAPAPRLDETLQVPQESFDELKKERFDETLQITMEAVQSSDRECSKCENEYPSTAKFCPKCGTKNDKYSD